MNSPVAPILNVVPSKVKLASSSISPVVPAITILLSVKSSTFKLAIVAWPSTSRVELMVADPVILVESCNSIVPAPLVRISMSASESIVVITLVSICILPASIELYKPLLPLMFVSVPLSPTVTLRPPEPCDSVIPPRNTEFPARYKSFQRRSLVPRS